MNYLHRTIEAHPALGWVGSVFALLMSALAWFVEHVGDFAALFGLGAAVFGFAAGYYTFRIQRRAWLRDGLHRRR